MRVRALKDLQFSPPLKDTPKYVPAGHEFELPEDLVENSIDAGDVEPVDEGEVDEGGEAAPGESGPAKKTRKKTGKK